MASISVMILAVTVSFVNFAEATEPLAPSWARSMCERLMISAGLYRPAVKARIESTAPATVLNPRTFQVKVQRPGADAWATYTRTDRDLFDLRESRYYPEIFLDYEFYSGLKVLDLACGDGRLVENLRRRGVDAMGVDAHLGRYQKSKSYFVQAGAERTGFAPRSFDFVISTQGPLTYLPDDEKLMKAIFKEIHRILKPGGTLIVSPVEEQITAYLPPGLKVKSRPGPEWMAIPAENTGFESANYWLEIMRID